MKQAYVDSIMKKPITPAQAEKLKAKAPLAKIPEEVFEAFNELLVKHFSGAVTSIRQKDVIALIKKKMCLTNTDLIIENKWLDIEPFYKKQGWMVRYDKPGYCDQFYEPYFEFTCLK